MKARGAHPPPAPASLAQLLAWGAAQLRAAEIAAPMSDARALLAFAGGLDPARLTLHLAELAPAQLPPAFAEAVARRAGRVPVSHITGRRLFWGRSFEVTPDVLDPRPETELLVAEALAAPFARLLDLGTGSGCIALSCLCERPEARALASDISAPALEIARRNAKALGVAARAEFVVSDWFAGLAPQRFDLIVANPPYISADEMAALSPEVMYEPLSALSPGGDGLGAYRAICASLGRFLAPGGRALLEIGPSQAVSVQALLRQAGLGEIRVLRDLDGRDRVVCANAPPAS